ncbi:MAG TPA: hypothetical protein VHR45_07510 [Thermoanaerobaculia bacterium]|nr:hypothetical protein [Thermoanaerobaculia bacterium]
MWHPRPCLQVGLFVAGCALAATAAAAQIILGSETTVASSATFQSAPAAAADLAGDVVVVWQKQNPNGGWDIFARQYTDSGAAVGPEFQVNTTTGPGCRQFPAVGVDAAGNFVAVWQSDQENSGTGVGIYGQRFLSSGLQTGPQEFHVNTTTTNVHRLPAVAVAPDGRFVVVFQSDGEDGSSWGIFSQAYHSDGTPAGGQFAVNQTTAGAQHSPAVAFLAAPPPSGLFEVVWQSAGQDGSGGLAGASGIWGRALDGTGGAPAGETQIDVPTGAAQGHPRIGADPSGNYVVAWESVSAAGSGIYFRRFFANGNPPSTPLPVDAATIGSQRNPAVAADALGRFVVAWDSLGQDGSGTAVLAQLYDNSGQPPPGVGKLQLNATTPGDQSFVSLGMSAGGNLPAVYQSQTPAGDASVILAQPALLPGLQFFTIPPCRLVDTRQPNGPLGGPVLTSGQPRTFPLLSAQCVIAIPATAKAVAVNVTAVSSTADGSIDIYPGDAPPPPTSTVNFPFNTTRGNNAVLPLSRNGDGSVSIIATVPGSPGQVHVLIDASGYFQ